jgi:hypothetical protein
VLEPASAALVLSGTVTTAAKGPAVPEVETSDAGSGQTRVTVAGRILLGSEPRVIQRRVVAPETYFAQTFKQVLAKRGITIDKPVRIDSAPKDGVRVLAVHESPTLAVVVHELGKRSSNFAAEQLLRTLGAETLGRPGYLAKGPRRRRPLPGRRRHSARHLRHEERIRGSTIPTAFRPSKSRWFCARRCATSASPASFWPRWPWVAPTAPWPTAWPAPPPNATCAPRPARSPTSAACPASSARREASRSIFSILMNDVPSPIAARTAQDRITATWSSLSRSIARQVASGRRTWQQGWHVRNTAYSMSDKPNLPPRPT